LDVTIQAQVLDMIRDLKTFPLLSRLSDEDLALLAGVMREQRFPAGTEILMRLCCNSCRIC
ncbi:MAG: hypothetical protein IJL00_01685, partial [Clostridia bacterium]|nr:hypothetical protein [Clostridia bacterium]